MCTMQINDGVDFIENHVGFKIYYPQNPVLYIDFSQTAKETEFLHLLWAFSAVIPNMMMAI